MNGDLPARFGKGLFWNYAGRIGEYGIRFLFTSLIAKRLGPGEFGVYSFAYSAFVAGTLLGALGYEQALNNFVPPLASDLPKQRFLLRRTLALRALLMACLVVLGALIAPVLSRWVGPVASALVWVLPYLFWFNVANLLAYFWVGRLEVRLVAMVRIGVQAANYAAAWVLLQRGYGAQAMLLLLGATAALASLAYLAYTARFLRGPAAPLPMGRVHRFAVNTGIINGLNYVLGQQSDVALIGLLLRDSVQIGFYNLAAMLSTIAGTALLMGLEGVSLSALAEVAAKSLRDLATAWRSFMKITMLLSVPVLIFCALHAAKLVSLYGETYREAALLLQVYALFTAANRFLGGGTSTGTLYAMQREGWALGIRVATGILNVALAVALIPRWGAVGAVAATGFCGILTTAAEMALVMRVARAAYPLRFAVAVGVCTAAAGLASHFITGSGLWGLARGAAGLLAVFAACFVLLKPLDGEDMALAARLSPRLGRWAARLVGR
ncbi:MAG: hypothetical protein Kow00123_16350 [Anaerolineales bacterium]